VNGDYLASIGSICPVQGKHNVLSQKWSLYYVVRDILMSHLAIFEAFCEHDDDGHVLFPHHEPKVFHGIIFRALTRNEICTFLMVFNTVESYSSFEYLISLSFNTYLSQDLTCVDIV